MSLLSPPRPGRCKARWMGHSRQSVEQADDSKVPDVGDETKKRSHRVRVNHGSWVALPNRPAEKTVTAPPRALVFIGSEVRLGLRETASFPRRNFPIVYGPVARESLNPRVGGCGWGVTGAAKLVDLTVSGTTRALACRGGRLARRVGVGRRLIGEGADEHGRGGVKAVFRNPRSRRVPRRSR